MVKWVCLCCVFCPIAWLFSKLSSNPTLTPSYHERCHLQHPFCAPVAHSYRDILLTNGSAHPVLPGLGASMQQQWKHPKSHLLKPPLLRNELGRFDRAIK